MSASFQDMPPPGGFDTIKVEKVPPKPWIRQGFFAVFLVGLALNGFYYLREWRKKYFALRVEEIEHYIAASPFLEAERERNFLRHLYNIREEERELMKDYPGWKLGTLFGEKLQKTLPPDTLPSIKSREYIAHRTDTEFIFRHIIPDDHI